MDAIEAGETILRCIDRIREIYADNGERLSEVDKEICDVMHLLEFTPIDIQRGYSLAKQLQDARRERRAIKDSCELTSIMHKYLTEGNSKAFTNGLINQLNGAKKRKAQLDNRIYTPRSKAYQTKEEE